MSAFSVSPVASSGSNAQASSQPDAADDAADNSPFAMLLAAISAADPELQAGLQATMQPDTTQAPASDSQLPPLANPPAANDDGVDQGIATAAFVADTNTDIAQDPAADLSATPKSGTKPDKKANTDKPETDIAAAPLPAQSPPVLPQPPIAPMAQAAVQTQAVASNDNDGDNSPVSSVGVDDAVGTTPAAQSRVIPGDKPVTATADPSQPAPPQSSQIDAKQIARPVQLFTADDAGSDDGDIATDTASADQNAPAIQAGVKFVQPRNTNNRSATTATPGSATPAVADDDAGTEIPPSDIKPPVTMPSQAVAGGLETASQNVPLAAAQHLPRKSVQDTLAGLPADPADAPPLQPANAAPSAKDKIENFDPASPAPLNNDNDGKPAHVTASAAPQVQPDAPQPPSHTAQAALPQATLAIDPAATKPAGGLSLSVPVAIHDSDSRPSAPQAVIPDTDSLAISVAARSLSGAKQFDIRLDPPELGRVEVRLSIDASGKTQAHMTTDQPRTLELLQKDAPNLTRALRDAGLDVSQSGLNFSLKGQGQHPGQGGQNGNFGARTLSLPAIAQSIEAAQSAGALPSLAGNARLDIHV